MDSLPFAKRPPRRPATVAAVAERGAFDPVDRHTPLNTQVWGHVPSSQMGLRRQTGMKITARAIDGRLGISERDRSNMFTDAGKSELPAFKTPPVLPAARRHERTPYDYQTGWISHAMEGTSLAPLDKSVMYKRLGLENPVQQEDTLRRITDREKKNATIRHFENQVQQYCDMSDANVKRIDDRVKRCIQSQRTNYADALEIRKHQDRFVYKHVYD